MNIDPEWLKILACPFCVTRPLQGKSTLARGELELQGPADSPSGLKCKDCGRLYRIENELPNFLVDEAVVPKA